MKPIYNTYLQLCFQNFNLGIILCKYYYSVLIGLIPPHLCACPRTGSGFGSHDNFYIQWFEVVCFVDNGGIVDYHCLSFHFIINKNVDIKISAHDAFLE